LARLCAKVGADVTEVAYGMGLDTRIGTHFLRAGLGYGGSCFPKDTSALTELARRNGVHLSLLDAVQQINESQPAWFVTQLKAVIPDLSQTRIAVLGLSFKPETDDLREAASLRLIPLLLQEGAQLVAFDPLVNDRVSEMFADVEFVSDPYEALDQADCALLVTEWKVCVELDFSRVKNLMRRPLLFDGRNAWPLDTLRQLGFTYLGVGRA
ncbi:MAG: UDP binding domain-containing protein, partial [Clostridia bacterium]